jgi:membrane-bound metal-dependent hydrolase YbcI (DUF457 family)
MPTPIAHALMGATITAVFPFRRDEFFAWRAYLVGGFLGAAPDLDCLLGFLPVAPFTGRNWHHDFTHSFGFAFLCGALCTLLLGRRPGPRWRTVLVLSGAMASHAMLDCMFTDSAGVDLFWPFSHDLVQLGLPSLVYQPPHHSLAERIVGLALIAVQEVLVFGSFFLFVWLVRRLGWRSVSEVSR